MIRYTSTFIAFLHEIFYRRNEKDIDRSIAGTIAQSDFSTVQIRASCFENEKSITAAAD